MGNSLTTALALISCKTNIYNESSKTNIKEVVTSPDVTLVDVRIPEQYAVGTAKNAINIPLAEIQNNIEILKGKNSCFLQ